MFSLEAVLRSALSSLRFSQATLAAGDVAALRLRLAARLRLADPRERLREAAAREAPAREELAREELRPRLEEALRLRLPDLDCRRLEARLRGAALTEASESLPAALWAPGTSASSSALPSSARVALPATGVRPRAANTCIAAALAKSDTPPAVTAVGATAAGACEGAAAGPAAPAAPCSVTAATGVAGTSAGLASGLAGCASAAGGAGAASGCAWGTGSAHASAHPTAAFAKASENASCAFDVASCLCD